MNQGWICRAWSSRAAVVVTAASIALAGSARAQLINPMFESWSREFTGLAPLLPARGVRLLETRLVARCDLDCVVTTAYVFDLSQPFAGKLWLGLPEATSSLTVNGNSQPPLDLSRMVDELPREVFWIIRPSRGDKFPRVPVDVALDAGISEIIVTQTLKMMRGTYNRYGVEGLRHSYRPLHHMTLAPDLRLRLRLELHGPVINRLKFRGIQGDSLTATCELRGDRKSEYVVLTGGPIFPGADDSQSGASRENREPDRDSTPWIFDGRVDAQEPLGRLHYALCYWGDPEIVRMQNFTRQCLSC